MAQVTSAQCVLTTPRLLIAGLCGSSGKTVSSVGLVAAWRRQGRRVAPIKKGPDYIDAAWLGAAARATCRNLDLFIMPEGTVLASFFRAARRADVAVIEGSRGLHDGVDAAGTYSSAELAKLLRVPVVLVLDCRKTTRTAAAAVLGCLKLDPAVNLQGVILNRTAGPRHDAVLRQSLESVCHLPVLGAIPGRQDLPFPQRHLGLLPPQQHRGTPEALSVAADLAERHFDLEALWDIACTAPPLPVDGQLTKPTEPPRERVARIGVFRDEAFHFYYPENLEALEAEGAELIEVSPLHDDGLPALDALYIGGGFPESFATRLSSNERFRASLADAAAEGLPVYAECGGAVYLGESLVLEDGVHTMGGALPVIFGLGTKPQGHGYAIVKCTAPNPFYPVGVTLRGHEFHYSFVKEYTRSQGLAFALEVTRGHGIDGQVDGLCYRNLFAAYTHIHALAVPGWAGALVRRAARWRKEGR